MAKSDSVLTPVLPLTVLNGGLFISRGVGRHPDRVIDSWELIVVERGRLGMFEGDCQFELGPGQALVLRPGRRHGGTLAYPADLSFFWFHFRLNDPDAGDALPTVAAGSSRLSAWCRDFLTLQQEGSLQPLRGGLLLLLMLQELNAGAIVENDGGRLAAAAMKYIKLHFTEPVSTADIADALHCNPDYLGRVFRTAYGRTPVESLNSERLNYASGLLLETVMNINEVGEAAGYADPAYFRRRFRAEYGMTPLRFRRLYGKIHVNTR